VGQVDQAVADGIEILVIGVAHGRKPRQVALTRVYSEVNDREPVREHRVGGRTAGVEPSALAPTLGA
jgi:hypothetical protein